MNAKKQTKKTHTKNKNKKQKSRHEPKILGSDVLYESMPYQPAQRYILNIVSLLKHYSLPILGIQWIFVNRSKRFGSPNSAQVSMYTLTI